MDAFHDSQGLIVGVRIMQEHAHDERVFERIVGCVQNA